MIKDFEGKVAVITGGASGIGLALARAFAKRGMKLVLADINKEALDKASKEFSDNNIEVMTLVTDVSDPEQVAALADASYERFGHVNILCNNAGIAYGGPIKFMTQKNWEWVYGVNLYGVIYGIQCFLSRMLASRESCHIINTSSLAGLIPGDSEPYPSSKSAVITLSESLAYECFGSNVSVSVICPAFVRSNIVRRSEELSKEQSGIWKFPLQTDNSGVSRSVKAIDLGMDPEFMADLVIKAVENDIFLVFTHPEYLPALKARFERIYDDTMKLYDGLIDKKTYKTKIYQNESPAFIVTYPEYFIKTTPSPFTKAIFTAGFADWNIEIFVSKVIPKKRFEGIPKRIVKGVSFMAKEIKIISNEPITLKDGTLAYETIIDYKMIGHIKTRSIHISVFKDNNWIRVSVNAGANNVSQQLKEIAKSLKFK